MDTLSDCRNIFIDTCIFHKQNFSFSSLAFERLISFSKGDLISIYLTPITISEVKKSICKEVEDSLGELKKIRNKAKILKNAGTRFSALFEKYENNPEDVQKLKDALISHFNGFCDQARVNIISISQVSIDRIFDMYFKKTLPFNHGKKEKEFPDAFVILALEKWCVENKERLIVITEDVGFKDAINGVESLFHLESIEKFIDLLLKEEEATFSDYAELVFEEFKREINDEISKQIEQDGMELADEIGEVVDIDVKSLDIFDHYLISVSDNSATFKICADVTFSAYVYFDDYTTAPYEGGQPVMIIDQYEGEVERTIFLEGTINLNYSFDSFDYFEIDSMELEYDNGLTVDVDSDHLMHREK